MGKQITAEQKAEFRAFCVETLANEGDPGYFCLCHFEPFEATTEDDEPLWEFHASNYNPEESHDIFELFESVGDQFTIEQHGYDEFWICKK